MGLKTTSNHNYTSSRKIIDSYASKYRNNYLGLEELIDVGIDSYIKADKKFDPERGSKFLSFFITILRRDLSKAIKKAKKQAQIEDQTDYQLIGSYSSKVSNQYLWIDDNINLYRQIDRLERDETRFIESNYGLAINNSPKKSRNHEGSRFSSIRKETLILNKLKKFYNES